MTSAFEMAKTIKEVYGLRDQKVLSAIVKVPREEFVDENDRHLAYGDNPIPIGFGQTISQPYTVAFMTHLLGLRGNEKVLEIGTGSGYQAAILSLLTKKVYTIERIEELAKSAKERLSKLGFKNIEIRAGAGEFGWKEKAPFDAIMVTAGVEGVPQELFDQLKEGGVLVAPVGEGPDKVMTKFIKKKNKISKEEFGVFHFVPLVENN